MATSISQTRTALRRAATVEEILDHAQAILDDQGASAITVSEIARRMGMRAPSLYKYFDSLNAIQDRLFARGQTALLAYVEKSVRGLEPGLSTLLAGNRAFIRWSISEIGLASLLFWRPIPGFEPSAEAYAPALVLATAAREQLRIAAERGELSPAADSDEAYRLLTVVVSGVFSQQAANQPGADFDDGHFSSLTDEALQMFVRHYRPTPKEAS